MTNFNENSLNSQVIEKINKFRETYEHILSEEELKKIQEEFIINKENLGDKVQKISQIKCRFNLKILQHKKSLLELDKILEETKNLLIKIKENSNNVRLSKLTISKEICDEQIIKDINDSITIEKEAIIFYKNCLDISSTMSYDVNNLINYIKMEST